MEELLFNHRYRSAEKKLAKDIVELCLAFEHFTMSEDRAPQWVRGRLAEDTYVVTGIADGIDVRLYKNDDVKHVLGVWIRRSRRYGLQIWPYALPR